MNFYNRHRHYSTVLYTVIYIRLNKKEPYATPLEWSLTVYTVLYYSNIYLIKTPSVHIIITILYTALPVAPIYIKN